MERMIWDSLGWEEKDFMTTLARTVLEMAEAASSEGDYTCDFVRGVLNYLKNADDRKLTMVAYILVRELFDEDSEFRQAVVNSAAVLELYGEEYHAEDYVVRNTIREAKRAGYFDIVKEHIKRQIEKEKRGVCNEG